MTLWQNGRTRSRKTRQIHNYSDGFPLLTDSRLGRISPGALAGNRAKRLHG